MTNEQKMDSMRQRLEQGILLARKRMLHEKSLRGQDVILGDGNSGIVRIPAKEMIAAHKDCQ